MARNSFIMAVIRSLEVLCLRYLAFTPHKHAMHCNLQDRQERVKDRTGLVANFGLTSVVGHVAAKDLRNASHWLRLNRAVAG